MEDWVYRALAKWPNVPAVFGWMGLDRRGRWLIRGEIISRPQIIDTINRNYAADEQGRWFFQNGPQRGYVALAYTPLILRLNGKGQLQTHTELFVECASAAFLDEHGALTLMTEHGAGVLDDQDLAWALERLQTNGHAVDEQALAAALGLASGEVTALQLRIDGCVLPVRRLDAVELPGGLGFVREPGAT
jgi:hypothetical protein